MNRLYALFFLIMFCFPTSAFAAESTPKVTKLPCSTTVADAKAVPCVRDVKSKTKAGESYIDTKAPGGKSAAKSVVLAKVGSECVPGATCIKTLVMPAPVVFPKKLVIVESDPLYKKWWFWTIVGVVAAGTTVAILCSGEGKCGATATRHTSKNPGVKF